MTHRLNSFFTPFRKSDSGTANATNAVNDAGRAAPVSRLHVTGGAAGCASPAVRPVLPLAGLSVRGRYVLRHSPILQIAAIFAFWLLGEAIVRFAGIPVPGGIIGMVIVFVLLASRRISLHSMRRGAQWYLAEMLLFFIPAVLALLNHHELFGLLGAKVLLVILGSTASVIAVTALVMDLFMRFRGRHGLV
ncbi:CidA/LrgA family protein [Thalassospira sp. TSL5-1]|uniref:CidA/LrgA family protein n=1 Tax=Thalassospira sp. TSL5-1 TaxID=1544451 RepID=UPI0009FA4A67|nr:CidA/LrgA family protein [Thalassospira sp. TSL5-1]